MIVRGLSERRVYRSSDLFSILREGSDCRSIGATEMNKQSSRSHAIFTITICKVSETEGTMRGKINFVDLAGSERLDKTKATGNRAQEGISINKSLSTLSKVIEALSTHQSHIPYRESSLTRILKDSLGGNAKTVMIACISPADSNHSETVNTLRWADQARKIQNKPVVNLDPTTAEILKLKQRIADLEEIVARYEGQSGSLSPSLSSSFLPSSVNMTNRVATPTAIASHVNHTLPSSPSSQASIELLEREVARLRQTLLSREDQLQQVQRDLDYLLSHRRGRGPSVQSGRGGEKGKGKRRSGENSSERDGDSDGDDDGVSELLRKKDEEIVQLKKQLLLHVST